MNNDEELECGYCGESLDVPLEVIKRRRCATCQDYAKLPKQIRMAMHDPATYSRLKLQSDEDELQRNNKGV